MPSLTRLLLLALMTAGSAFRPALASAWQPPIGIPAPSFGINEVAPATPNPWTSNVPGFYYVQSGGTNSGNGYPGSPRDSIPSTLAAGSVVIVNGTYDVNHSNSPITANGTASAPVYIRGLSNTQRPTITQKWEVNGSYYILEYINAKWRNSSGNGKLVYYGNHGVIRHIDASGDLNSGIGGIEGGGTDMVIWDNIVHNQGDYQKSTDDDTGGIFVGSGQRIWAVDNTCYQNGRACVAVNPGYYSDGAVGNQQIQYVYVGRNKAWQNRETNFWSKHANHVIFSQNTSFEPVDNRPGNGPIGMGFQYGPENVWFLFNHIYNAESGIVIQGNSVTNPGQNTYIIGNVIHDISGDGIRLRGGTTIHLANNTIYTTAGAGMNAPEAGIENTYRLWNNIISNSSGGAIQTNDASRWQINNLLSFQQSYTGSCEGCTATNPLFVNPTGADFHLQPGSPAIDAGTSSPVYATFLTLYGIDIARDIEGKVRPENRKYDIGAYEGAGLAAGTPPAAPTNLKVY